MKTKFASKVVFFEETLEYARTITICYNCQSLHLHAYILSNPTWAIVRALTKILNPIVKQCVFNQITSYWLLSNALYVAISISIKLQVEILGCLIFLL
jgi:hypothetical protein